MLNYILLAAVPALFGFNTVAGRALAGVIEPGQLTLVRWVCAGGLIGGLALLRGREEQWKAAPASWPWLLALGALGMGFCSYAAYFGTKTTTATNVSLIYATTAAVVLTVEWLLRQSKASLLLVIGVVLCLTGAATIITKGRLDTIAAVEITVGDLWGVAGMLGWAGYTIALKHLKSALTPFAMFTATAIGGMLFALPFAALESVEHGVPQPSLRDVVWVAAMVLLSGVGAYLAYSAAIRRVGPIMTSAALTLIPLATPLFAMLLVGEQLAWFHAAGGALVISGLGLINLDKARAPKQ